MISYVHNNFKLQTPSLLKELAKHNSAEIKIKFDGICLYNPLGMKIT